jgi:hypothetical protein
VPLIVFLQFDLIRLSLSERVLKTLRGDRVLNGTLHVREKPSSLQQESISRKA